MSKAVPVSKYTVRKQAGKLVANYVRRVMRSSSCAEKTPVAMMLSLPDTPE